MAELDKAKIATRIYNSLKKKGLLKEVEIKRIKKNAFKGKESDEPVCIISGYYHREEPKVEIESTESATLNKLYNNKFLVVNDDNGASIEIDDFFTLNNITYRIIDKGSIEDIVFDMYLLRM